MTKTRRRVTISRHSHKRPLKDQDAGERAGKQMRKKKKGCRVLLGFILLFGGLAVVALFSPLLLLTGIHVDNQAGEAAHYTKEQIIQAAGINTGENAFKYLGGSFEYLLKFRMGEAEKRTEALPWVKTAIVQYHFPATVQINITERHAIAWIRHMGHYLLIDEEGYVMEVALELDEQYPEIRGIQLNQFSVGKMIGTQIPEKITWLVELLRRLDYVDRNDSQKLIEVLDWIDFLEKKELCLSLDGRITAKIQLDDELTYHLSFLKEVYYTHIRPEEKGMIDIFDEKYARFITE